ncbi:MULTISPECIES: iron chelate uptake ABC transporter family permease subunit [unclassified Clostridioides]|uniref:iron chelate uptake ABC transporter family permease subunit n=1 Tax=unclassified Clostridioides TaxID=2635829 RepID=UPI001D10A55D|nr:iron chelate uptake ABC transporter family permease subunit [Clostridioides sp. ZZV14-6150]MCC0668368.1 iron chelate uptake ABC transporter family permease subunit [Clostridioides sp. ZZV14-6153]MCC0722191.1 iron chelate uptake ABC transporter family permease subunit [Clostridioides sp. ZZV14-6104]MCC0725060.1 iron chelate uptake ABC transporter family permease subunit [Clostridioides sp. ZZV14-6045]MCC0732083.1 iron chelate uptake ABC transporter family permease subunit [Clostridioides sp. 
MKLSLNKKIYLMTALLLISMVLFLTYGIDMNNLDYALSQRIPKVLAMILGGGCIAFTTVVFQTITNNQILTPSVLGLDSLYVMIQTIIVFIFGATSILIINENYNFIINVTIMIVASMLLYRALFERKENNIFFLILVGMVFGTLFKSATTFIQVMIDPNEFLALQTSIMASLNNINTNVLLIAFIIVIATIPFIYDDIKYLDVLSLGREQAINLGVDFDKVVKKMIILIAILVSVSTALIGPMTFLGLLLANIAREVFKTYKHTYLILGSILLGIITLIIGQFFIQHIFKFDTTLSVVINFIGGIYFIQLLLKGANR